MKLKIKKMDERFIMPKKAHIDDACFDCFATDFVGQVDNIGRIKKYIYKLGFAVEPPVGYSIELYPRSSIRKHDVVMANSVGIIDNGYRGEIQVTFLCSPLHTDYNPPYEIGERVCQIKLVKDNYTELELVDDLNDTERGIGGHGSSGE